MSIVVIDPEKCRHDGVCVAECPMALLVQADKDAAPTAIENAEEFCINCGHCLAVCPHGALSLKAMPIEECPTFEPGQLPSSDQMDLALKSRRSIRVYRKEPLSREVIREIIDTARYAPSGHNVQPVRWLVYSDPKDIQRLASLVMDWIRGLVEAKAPLAELLHLDRAVVRWEGGTDVILRNAPHLVVTHAHKEERTAPAASTIALTYLDLAATARGLGVCWAGFMMAASAMHPPLAEALALPDGHVAYGAMMLGRPKFTYQRVPRRRPAPITWR